MFAKRDEHYPSKSEETNLATEATYFSKPVTKVNFGPSKIHKAALVHLFGIPSLPLYLDVMYVSSKGAGEVFIWTTDRSGVSKGRDEGGNFKEGNANSRRHISCHSPEKHILCFLKGNLTMVFIA